MRARFIVTKILFLLLPSLPAGRRTYTYIYIYFLCDFHKLICIGFRRYKRVMAALASAADERKENKRKKERKKRLYARV